LVKGDKGLSLVDWEAWREGWTPYWDLFTFLYKPYSLLQQGEPQEFLRHVDASAPLSAYEEELSLPRATRREALLWYLSESDWEPEGHPARHFRMQVRDLLI
jgi:hypothetical protein